MVLSSSEGRLEYRPQKSPLEYEAISSVPFPTCRAPLVSFILASMGPKSLSRITLTSVFPVHWNLGPVLRSTSCSSPEVHCAINGGISPSYLVQPTSETISPLGQQRFILIPLIPRVVMPRVARRNEIKSLIFSPDLS